MAVRCPGQDTRFWTPKDVYEIPCPACGNMVEFFKDDPSRKCEKCDTRFRNPRIDMGCAKWCAYAAECIDYQGDEDTAVSAPSDPHSNHPPQAS